MEKEKQLELDALLIAKLQGKMTLLQPEQERVAMVILALQEIFADEKISSQYRSLKETAQRDLYIDEFLSYGVIEQLLGDADVEDIIINSLKMIFIHHAQKGFVSTKLHFPSHKELDLFVKKLILFAGKDYQSKKIMNLELPNLEGRVNIAFSPFGPQMTITKAKMEPLSILDLIARGGMTYEVAGQLWLYLEGLCIRPANIIIAGGPGTGKTTLLNALLSFIPGSDRTVIIEDTLELNTFLEDSCSRLESDDDLSLADLVKNSLRMRPDRIIVGEVRGAEAQDMITAVNVGKYCIGTIHALTSREAILRLQNEPMNVPEVLVNLVDVFIVLKRYHVQDRLFRVIDEVSETSGLEQKVVLLSQIYKYDYERKTIKQVSTSTVYRDHLAQQSGLTPRDIIDEVYFRSIILKTMAEKGMTTLTEVTSLCRLYSQNAEDAAASLGLRRKDYFTNAPKKR